MSWPSLGIARYRKKRFSGSFACSSNIKWYDVYDHDMIFDLWWYDHDVICMVVMIMNIEESIPVDSLWQYVNMFPSCLFSKCKESKEPCRCAIFPTSAIFWLRTWCHWWTSICPGHRGDPQLWDLPFHRRFWPWPSARVSWVTSTAPGHHGHLRWRW